jgi:hypothetical protein
MHTSISSLSAKWLNPILTLLEEKEFGEAHALAEFFPNTMGRRMAQCVALIGQEKLLDADHLIRTNPEIWSSVSEFGRLMLQFRFDPEDVAQSADWLKSDHLAFLCLESCLSLPHKDKNTVLNQMLSLARLRVRENDLEMTKQILLRLAKLDDSPSALVRYARIATAHPSYYSSPEPQELARVFIDEAIAKVSEGSEESSEVYCAIVVMLMEKRCPDFNLIVELLQKVIITNERRRIELLSLYLELRHMDDGPRELFLERAVSLSSGLEEFITHEHNSLEMQLVALLEDQPIHRTAQWYSEKMEYEVARSLFMRADSREGIEALSSLIKHAGSVPKERLLRLFKMLSALWFDRPDSSLMDPKVFLVLFARNLTAPIPTEFSEVLLDLARRHGRSDIEKCLKRLVKNRELGIRLDSLYSMRGISSPPLKASAAYGQLAKPLRSLYMKLKEFFVPGKEPREVSVERHTLIDFPTKCTLERKVKLRIQLTKAAPKLTRVLGTVRVPAGLDVKEVRLEVHITAPGFALQGEWHQSMVLPVDQDSETITFTLVPLEPGHQVVEIEFFYKSSRVGYVIAETYVQEWESAEEASKFRVMEEPVETSERIVQKEDDPRKRLLFVQWFEREAKIEYRIHSSDPSENGIWVQSSPEAQEQIARYLQDLNAFLYEVVTQADPTDEEWEATCLNLEGVGQTLFNALIPSQLGDHVRKWKPGSRVMVSTNEQWIPWELIYDGQDFWGKKFIIGRCPRISDRSQFPQDERPTVEAPRQLRRIVNVVGGGVPQAEGRRAAKLFEQVLPGVQVRLIEEEPVSVFSKALPGTDAIHCTCHGYLDPYLLQFAKEKTRILNLLPETIQRLPLEPGCMVFANACSSTVPLLTFGKFSSYGWEFYRRGAGVFVGTLGAVPTKHAVAFAESVYLNLFGQGAKPSVGEAVAEAKKAAANERNLFWLLYCIYGDPDYSVGTA